MWQGGCSAPSPPLTARVPGAGADTKALPGPHTFSPMAHPGLTPGPHPPCSHTLAHAPQRPCAQQWRSPPWAVPTWRPPATRLECSQLGAPALRLAQPTGPASHGSGHSPVPNPPGQGPSGTTQTTLLLGPHHGEDCGRELRPACGPPCASWAASQGLSSGLPGDTPHAACSGAVPQSLGLHPLLADGAREATGCERPLRTCALRRGGWHAWPAPRFCQSGFTGRSCTHCWLAVRQR